MNNEEINLIIIDQDSLFWEGFRYLLEKNRTIHVDIVTDDKTVFFPLLEQPSEKIVLISGQFLQQYKREFNKILQLPHLKGMIISDRSENYLSDALDVGAIGYSLKDMSYEGFIEAIRSVSNGLYWFHPHVTGPILKEYVRVMPKIETRAKKMIAHHFTRRELDVLNLLAKGYNNKMIARELDVTNFTVSSHIRSILKKCNVHDRTAAVVKAFENGWVKIDPKIEKEVEILDEE